MSESSSRLQGLNGYAMHMKTHGDSKQLYGGKPMNPGARTPHHAVPLRTKYENAFSDKELDSGLLSIGLRLGIPLHVSPELITGNSQVLR